MAAPAEAQLAVDRLWVDFEPKATPRADIIVRNESKDRYYVTVAPAEIVQPGTDKEQRVDEADPDKLGLLVTPNRLILDPGAMRSIRIVSLNQNLTSDRIYRVKITPQVGQIEAPSTTTDRALAIKVLAAYDILVTVRPAEAKAKLVTTRDADNLVIRNEGNTNMLLFDGELCPPKTDGKSPACESVGADRLYPGTSWNLHAQAPGESLTAKARSFASVEPKTITLP